MHQLKLLLALGVLYPTTSASAQKIVPPSHRRSPFSNAASIFTVSEATRLPSSASPAEIYLKPPRDQSSAPLPWVVDPDGLTGQYSMDSLFGVTLAPLVDIDAMSSGNAYIPTDAGEPDLDNTWASALISVTNESAAGPETALQGWFTEREEGEFGPVRTTPGADLVIHYFEGSSGVHQSIVGKTMFLQLAEHLGLSDDQDISAMDLGAGVIRESPFLAGKLLFTKGLEFYFSITPESASAINSGGHTLAYDLMGLPLQADAATVYKMEWYSNPGPGGNWSAPTVFLSRTDLGIPADTPTVTENIDALCVGKNDFGAPGDNRIAFSMQPKQGRSQLLVHENGASQPYYTLLLEEGSTEPATEAFGLREWESETDDGDDVDAVCIFDPEALTYDNLVGFSVDNNVSDAGSGPLGLSVCRMDSAQSGNNLLFQVTGAPNGPTPLGATAIPVMYLYYFVPTVSSPTAPQPGKPGWQFFGGAYHSGLSSEFIRDLSSVPGMGIGETVYFYAEIRDRSIPTQPLLRTSWTMAIDY